MGTIDWVFLTKAYFLPTIIIVAFLALFTPYAVGILGPAFGTATSYIAQGIVIMIGIWLARKAEKHL